LDNHYASSFFVIYLVKYFKLIEKICKNKPICKTNYGCASSEKSQTDGSLSLISEDPLPTKILFYRVVFCYFFYQPAANCSLKFARAKNKFQLKSETKHKNLRRGPVFYFLRMLPADFCFGFCLVLIFMARNPCLKCVRFIAVGSCLSFRFVDPNFLTEDFYQTSLPEVHALKLKPLAAG